MHKISLITIAALAVAAGVVLAPPARSGELLVHYTFEEYSGDALDQSGLSPAADGSLVGSAIRTNATASGGGYALDLLSGNGADNNYLTAADALTDRTEGLTNFTVTMWLDLLADPAINDRLFSKGNTYDMRVGSLTASTNFNLLVVVDRDPLADVGQTFNGLDASNKWVFLAVTYEGTSSVANLKLYTGGVGSPVALFDIARSVGTGAVANGTADLRIGSTTLTTGDRTPPAYVDDFRFYRGALTPAELEAIRVAETNPPPALPPLPSPPTIRTVTTNALEDVYIAHNAPNANYNDVSRISVGVYTRNHPSVSRAGFVQFQIPPLEKGEVVTNLQVSGVWRDNRSGEAPAVVVGLLTNPDLTTLTWNSCVAADIITGRDGTDYHVLWGTNVAVLTGEEWPAATQVIRTETTNDFVTFGSGLVKFVNDRISTTQPTLLTLGFGGPAGDNDYTFNWFSLEAWDSDAVPQPGIFSPVLTVNILVPPPAPLGTVVLLR